MGADLCTCGGPTGHSTSVTQLTIHCIFYTIFHILQDCRGVLSAKNDPAGHRAGKSIITCIAYDFVLLIQYETAFVLIRIQSHLETACSPPGIPVLVQRCVKSYGTPLGKLTDPFFQ